MLVGATEEEEALEIWMVTLCGKELGSQPLDVKD